MTKSETGWDKRRMRTIMVLEAVRDHARRGFTWETPAGLLCDPPVEYPEGTTEDQVKRALTQLRKEGVVTYERPGGGTDGTPGGWRSLCDYDTCQCRRHRRRAEAAARGGADSQGDTMMAIYDAFGNTDLPPDDDPHPCSDERPCGYYKSCPRCASLAMPLEPLVGEHHRLAFDPNSSGVQIQCIDCDEWNHVNDWSVMAQISLMDGEVEEWRLVCPGCGVDVELSDHGLRACWNGAERAVGIETVNGMMVKEVGIK